MNKKGFTLIELLVTIAVLGLVIGISAYGIINAIDKSKNEALAITENNIKKAAKIYSEEVDESKWNNIINPIISGEVDENTKNSIIDETKKYKYYCVTIEELINKGLLKDEDIPENNLYNRNSTIITKKNKITFTVDKQEIIPASFSEEYDEMSMINEALCRGTVIEDYKPTIPIIKNTSSTTSEINFNYEPSSYPQGATSIVKSHVCMLSDNHSDLLNNKFDSKVEDESSNGNCSFEGLKTKSYYVKVCMESDKTINTEFYASCSDIVKVLTKSIEAPIIEFDSYKTISINFSNENISQIGGNEFVFTTLDSGIKGRSNIEVYKCNITTNQCDYKTSVIENYGRYKLPENINEVKIEFEGTNNVNSNTIAAATYDKADNSATNSYDFKLSELVDLTVTHTVTFYKGLADKIDGKTSEFVTKSCTAQKGETCTITTPTITRSGYTAVGWAKRENSTIKDLDFGMQVEINSSSSYYPITKKEISIIFDKNNAVSISSTKETCSMYNADTSCIITTPSITPSNCNRVVGWAESASSSLANYNVGEKISVNKNKTYYAITNKTAILNNPVLTNLIYNGSNQSIKNINNTTLSGTSTATDVGTYTAYYTPNEGYCWKDGTNTKKPVVWKINPFTVTLNISGVSNSSYSKKYEVTNTSNNLVKIACGSSSCNELGAQASCTSSSCKTSSGIQALSWSGKKPIISWSSTATNANFNVEYDTNFRNSGKYNGFNNAEFWTYSTSGSSGNMTVSTDGYRIIKITASNGNAKIEIDSYFSLDFEAPTITLPSGTSNAWGMNNYVNIKHEDYGSKLKESVNAYSTTTIPVSDISCINGTNDAKNFCKITNSGKKYGSNVSSDLDMTACTTNTYCHQNYYILWACSSDNVGNSTCSRRTNPKATQIDYKYLVKDD